MRLLYTILLTFLLLPAFAQANYIAVWETVGSEKKIVNYQVQKSSDSLGFYTTIATIQPKRNPDSNSYSFTLPFATNYYRIKSLRYHDIIYTKAIKIVISNNSVSISNAILKLNTSSDNLSFNVTGETTVNYYLIENYNGSVWVTVGKITATGAGKYIVNISRNVNKQYRLIPFYKDGSKGSPTNFN